MKNLILFSVLGLLINTAAFADTNPQVKSRLKTLIVENKLDEAKEFANREIQNSADHDVVRKRGFVHFMQGDHKSAVQDFTHYLSKKPDSAKGYLYRGLSLIAMGDEENGKSDINRALKLNPSLKSTVQELTPKVATQVAKKASKHVPMTTKKGVPIRTKKGDVVYKSKR
jgi:tetratricopeptide (TPR) repeat protein